MENDPLALYGAIVGTISLLLYIYTTRKTFKVTFKPKCRRNHSAVGTREYRFDVRLSSGRGDVIIYSIGKISGSFFSKIHGSKLEIIDLKNHRKVVPKRSYHLKVEQNIPTNLRICFHLPDSTKVPFTENTGIQIQNSVRNVKKKFILEWR